MQISPAISIAFSAIARKAMAIAADICIYTNGNVTLEQLTSEV